MFHKIDLEGARAFVLAHSSEWAQARLAGILEGARPPKEVIKALEASQNADGGFARGWQARLARPGLAEDAARGSAPTAGSATSEAPASSLDTTCFLLDQLRDLPPLTGSPMASRALSFLRRAQRRDGSWAEEGAPWLAGEAGAAYLTANLTFTLLTLDPSNRDPINWGLRWLDGHLDGAYTQTLFLTWAAAWRHGNETLAAKAWGVLEDRLTEADLTWLLSGALHAGVGGRYLVPIAQLLAQLTERQAPDGGWPGEDRLEETLKALRVLRGFSLI